MSLVKPFASQLTAIIYKYILKMLLPDPSEEIDVMRQSILVTFSALALLLSSSVASEADSIIAQMNTPYSYSSTIPPYGTVRVAPFTDGGTTTLPI